MLTLIKYFQQCGVQSKLFLRKYFPTVWRTIQAILEKNIFKQCEGHNQLFFIEKNSYQQPGGQNMLSAVLKIMVTILVTPSLYISLNFAVNILSTVYCSSASSY